MYPKIQMYIDGQWVSAATKAKILVENPTTEALIGTIQEGTAADAQRALESAQAAQPGWAATPAIERGNILAILKKDHARTTRQS